MVLKTSSDPDLTPIEDVASELGDCQFEDRKPWRLIARPEQIRPCTGVHWLYLAGRGAGKTRSAAERIRERIVLGQAQRIALIAPNLSDARDIMVEGESGLWQVARSQIETYNRSQGEILFDTGARARFFSGEDPESLRGWQSTDVWGDELCAWRYGQATFDMAMFGLRLGDPEAIWTTTPKNVPVLRSLMQHPDCVITRSTTYANRENLSPVFFQSVVRKYEGTNLGRQELEGQIMEEVAGALWQRSWFDRPGFRRPSAINAPASEIRPQSGNLRFTPPEHLVKVIVAIDPSVSDPERRKNAYAEPDACGIVVAGIDAENRGYVLADCTAVMSPGQWARTSVSLYDLFHASGIIAEANQGGEMIREVIKGIASNVPIHLVHAALGKRPRAEPVAHLYEQGRVSHCGDFPDLEGQMTTWDATNPNSKSPNNVDALVWAFHGLGLCNATGLNLTQRISTASREPKY